MTEGSARLGRAVIDVVVYAVARLVLVVVLAGVIYGAGRALGVADFPPIVALLLALIVGMPLGMWVFTPLRRRATASLAAANARRRADREKLQARLRGDAADSK